MEHFFSCPAIPPFTAFTERDRLFAGLSLIVEESMSPLCQRAFKQLKQDPFLDQSENRFYSWTTLPGDRLFQGYVDKYGQPDGPGIVLAENEGLTFGNFSAVSYDFQAIGITKEGNTWCGNFKNNKRDGLFKVTRLTGHTSTQLFSMDRRLWQTTSPN